MAEMPGRVVAQDFLKDPILTVTADRPAVDAHHAHCCEACGHIWWHHRDMRLSKAEKRDQHKCPECASGPYQFGYNSQREAMEVRRLILAD